MSKCGGHVEMLRGDEYVEIIISSIIVNCHRYLLANGARMFLTLNKWGG